MLRGEEDIGGGGVDCAGAGAAQQEDAGVHQEAGGGEGHDETDIEDKQEQ